MRVEVFPLEKITIDNKEIMLGMNIDEVQKLIGIPDRVFSNCDGESGRHYYFDSELGLDFDESGLLEFIEFLGGMTGISDRIFMGCQLLKQVQMNCLR